jgi:Leucine-rich repeat (LRR) protein
MDIILNGKEIFENLELDENLEEKIQNSSDVLSDTFVSKTYSIGENVLKISKNNDFKALNENGDYACTNSVMLEGLILKSLPKSNHFQELVEMNRTEDEIFITSKFIEGETLKNTKLEHEENTIILFQCLIALYSMNEFKFVHGDLIEDNILIEEIEPEDREYDLNGLKFIIPDCRFNVRLIDFEFSRMDLNDNTCIFNENIRQRYYLDKFCVEYHPEIDIFKLLCNPRLSSEIKHLEDYKNLVRNVNFSSNYLVIPPFNGIRYEDVFNSNIFQRFKVNNIKIPYSIEHDYMSLDEADRLIEENTFDYFENMKDYRLCYRYLSFKDDVSIQDNFPIKLKNKIRSKYSNVGIDYITLMKVDVKSWLQEKDNFVISMNDEIICLNKLYFKNINELILNEVVVDKGSLSYIETFNSIQFINLSSYGINGIIEKTLFFNMLDKTNYIKIKQKNTITCINREYLKYNPRTHLISDKGYIGFTNEEHTALYNYTNKWNFAVNGYLRFSGTDDEYINSNDFSKYYSRYGNTKEDSFKNIKDAIEFIDRSFLSSNITHDNIILYRGVEKEEYITNVNLSYISTSKDLNVVEAYSGDNYIIEYHLDIGIPYIHLSHFSHFSDEEEILLPRGLISTVKEIIGKKYICTLSLKNSDQFIEKKQYNIYDLYDILDSSELKKSNAFLNEMKKVCLNNIFEDGNVLDPLTYDIIEEENLLRISNTCYHKNTIKQIVDEYNISVFNEENEGNDLLDPYTRNPISEDILNMFPNITFKILNNDDIDKIKDKTYIQYLNVVTEVKNTDFLSSLKELKELYLENNKITDISSLSSLTQLQTLYFNYNRITDISSLSSLTKLENLDLAINQITDISSLFSLAQLKELSLANNQITDISSLSSLTKLETLSLAINQIIDISSLSSLAQLKELSLTNNRITNISSLSSLTKLEILSLENNRITDISPLSSLTKLKNLDLENNRIIDISPLVNLKELETLYLNKNQITDISPLDNLKELETLYLNKNQITDISPLDNLKELKTLFLAINQIIDISSLSSLAQLKELHLNDNQITDISPLDNLKELTTLYLNVNQITDISSLSSLTKLQTLFLNNNKITNISSLSSLAQLNILYLNDNKITNISHLSSLAQLKELYLNNNKITDISSLSSLTKLEILSLNNNKITDISSLPNTIRIYI